MNLGLPELLVLLVMVAVVVGIALLIARIVRASSRPKGPICRYCGSPLLPVGSGFADVCARCGRSQTAAPAP